MLLSHGLIARICHETNKAYCEAIGDNTQKTWEEAEAWQRDSAVEGVAFRLANPRAAASAQHEAWKQDKEADGWTYGPVKDAFKKTHPDIVPYDSLALKAKIKDYLFSAIVDAFRRAVNEDNGRLSNKLLHESELVHNRAVTEVEL